VLSPTTILTIVLKYRQTVIKRSKPRKDATLKYTAFDQKHQYPFMAVGMPQNIACHWLPF